MTETTREAITAVGLSVLLFNLKQANLRILNRRLDQQAYRFGRRLGRNGSFIRYRCNMKWHRIDTPKNWQKILKVVDGSGVEVTDFALALKTPSWLSEKVPEAKR